MVLLRQISTIRYNHEPADPLVQQDVAVEERASNGDLLLALVCHHLREQNESPESYAAARESLAAFEQRRTA